MHYWMGHLGRVAGRAEADAFLEVVRIDQIAVALDVTTLTADDEDDEILLVARVRELTGSRRLDVAEPAGAELANLAADVEPGCAAVDEVELVLRVVEVVDALGARGHHDRVDAERRHPERHADLAEAVAVAEVVQGTECMCHAQDSTTWSVSCARSSETKESPPNPAGTS